MANYQIFETLEWPENIFSEMKQKIEIFELKKTPEIKTKQ